MNSTGRLNSLAMKILGNRFPSDDAIGSHDSPVTNMSRSLDPGVNRHQLVLMETTFGRPPSGEHTRKSFKNMNNLQRSKSSQGMSLGTRRRSFY
jgi:hypothetical protein